MFTAVGTTSGLFLRWSTRDMLLIKQSCCKLKTSLQSKFKIVAANFQSELLQIKGMLLQIKIMLLQVKTSKVRARTEGRRSGY